MKLSYAVLLLIGDASAKHHHHRSYEPIRPKKDISNKNIDPWVYEKVYEAVNPQAHTRDDKPPAKETYTPYGNMPYWPVEKKAAPAPADDVPPELRPKSFAQLNEDPTPQ